MIDQATATRTAEGVSTITITLSDTPDGAAMDSAIAMIKMIPGVTDCATDSIEERTVITVNGIFEELEDTYVIVGAALRNNGLIARRSKLQELQIIEPELV